jgi:hypothetical protein
MRFRMARLPPDLLHIMHPARSNPMLDAILLAGGLGVFAVSIAYAFACDRL